MEYLSVVQYAEKYSVSERTIRNYCATGKLDGAFLTGKTWNIPADAPLPKRTKRKCSPLLSRLIEEKDVKMKGGIYHRTQIDLTYNSNHIEGSRLTKEQTRYIFETNTLGITTGDTRIDDIMETVNHFRCIDYIIDHATEKITEAHIKHLHGLLKTNTSDSQKQWFAVGDYKRLDNVVGEMETCPVAEVHRAMAELLAWWKDAPKTFENLLDLHVRFERIHPFQDGNGRVGRLILLKECLKHGHTPFVIAENLRQFYYLGLSDWRRGNRLRLLDTCRTGQDVFILGLRQFGHLKLAEKAERDSHAVSAEGAG